MLFFLIHELAHVSVPASNLWRYAARELILPNAKLAQKGLEEPRVDLPGKADKRIDGLERAISLFAPIGLIQLLKLPVLVVLVILLILALQRGEVVLVELPLFQEVSHFTLLAIEYFSQLDKGQG